MDSLTSKLDGYPIVREVSLDMTIFHYPLGDWRPRIGEVMTIFFPKSCIQ